MTIAASYLPAASNTERDPAQYVPELSRRARGFAAWAIIKHLGRAGIAAIVERNCDAAAEIATLLAAEPGVTVVNDVVLNQIVVCFGGADMAIDGPYSRNDCKRPEPRRGVCGRSPMERKLRDAHIRHGQRAGSTRRGSHAGLVPRSSGPSANALGVNLKW